MSQFNGTWYQRLLAGWGRDVPGGYREVWTLGYPVIIAMVSQTVMWLVDTIMIGRIGTAPLAAVGFAGMVVWTSFSFFNGLLSSINTFVAQDYGRKDFRAIGRITWQGLYLAIASFGVILVAAIFGDDLFRAFSLSEEVKRLGWQYARIRVYFGLFVFTTFTISGFLRGIGDTKTPMLIAIVVNIINVGLDYTLIFGHFGFPRMEVQGAAIATSIASLISALLFLCVFFSGRRAKTYATREETRFSLHEMRRVLRIGFPMGVQFFLDMASFTVFSALIGHMGDAALAANNAAISLMSTSFMPLVGFSVAATTLVGQYIGAEKIHLARKSGYTTIRMGVVYTFVVAWFFIFRSAWLVQFISKEPEVIAKGAGVLRLAGIFQLFDGFGICANGALRGAGDTRFTMIVGLTYAWLMFLPLAYLFGVIMDGGVVGAWIGGTIYICLLGCTLFLRFRSDRWEKIQI